MQVDERESLNYFEHRANDRYIVKEGQSFFWAKEITPIPRDNLEHMEWNCFVGRQDLKRYEMPETKLGEGITYTYRYVASVREQTS